MNLYITGTLFKNGSVIFTDFGMVKQDAPLPLDSQQEKMLADGDYVHLSLFPLGGKWWRDPQKYPSLWNISPGSEPHPHWYQKKTHNRIFRKEACRWWKEHVYFHREIYTLANGTYFLKNCHVRETIRDVCIFCEDTIIDRMKGTSTAEQVCGSSLIRKMYDFSQVKALHGFSAVQEMNQHAAIGSMSDFSLVERMRQNAKIECMLQDARVIQMADSSIVGIIRGKASVSYMSDDALVGQAESGTQVGQIDDHAKIGSVSRPENQNDFQNPDRFYQPFM